VVSVLMGWDGLEPNGQARVGLAWDELDVMKMPYVVK
jgi:hypothetical protein